MILQWTNGADEAFVTLTRELDGYLAAQNGPAHCAYAPFNVMDAQTEAVVIFDGNTPTACGALRLHDGHTAEIKRMFVRPAFRRCGLAQQILSALEARAKALGCTRLILETSPTFNEAVALYRKLGFESIEPYGPYHDLCSLCMGKAIV